MAQLLLTYYAIGSPAFPVINIKQVEQKNTARETVLLGLLSPGWNCSWTLAWDRY